MRLFPCQLNEENICAFLQTNEHVSRSLHFWIISDPLPNVHN